MRLVAIDASPVGGGPVTHALTCAVQELPGAETTRVRLYDLFNRTCATCTDCNRTGRCTRHHPALDEAIVLLAEADTLIVGTTGHLHAHDPRGTALLQRLVGAFGHLQTARGLETRTMAESGVRKRAALICSAPLLLGPLAMLGMLPAGVAGVWRTLDRSGTVVVGCASVGTRWSGPASRDRATACARRLGKALTPQAHAPRVPAPGMSARRPAASPTRAFTAAPSS
jgi:hypothetical protein